MNSMERQDPARMSQDNIYPPPDSTNTGTSPFYMHHQHVTLGGHPQISHAPTAMMHNAPQGPSNDAMVDYRHHSQHSTPQQLAQQGLVVNTTDSGPPSNKKAKASRACDECRRKKIKCDAESDQPGVQCSACRRSDQRCAFSREPQKRGPSKGYIKELADRVNKLENKTGVADTQYPSSLHSSPHQNHPFYTAQIEMPGSKSNKRTRSMAEENFDDGRAHFHHNAQGPALAHTRASELTNTDDGLVIGISGETLQGYYNIIHPYFALLPDAKSELQTHLESASNIVRDAFNAAITIAVKSSDHTMTDEDMIKSSAICMQGQLDKPSVYSPAENVLQLQALIFMIIANHNGGPSRIVDMKWYGLATTLAMSMELHEQNGPVVANDKNVLGINQLGRRAWLILLVLDRWHAASTRNPLLIADKFTYLHLSDHHLLGTSGWHLVRNSLTLGHLSDLYLYKVPTLLAAEKSLGEITEGQLLAQSMDGEMQRFRETLEPHFQVYPHLHLAFLHTKLLSKICAEVYLSQEGQAVNTALDMVKILGSGPNMVPVLTEHSAALVSITLVQTLGGDPVRLTKVLNELRGVLETKRISPAWRSAINNFITAKLDAYHTKSNDRGGLQHLADAAVGANPGRGMDDGQSSGDVDAADLSAFRKLGYLPMFA